MARRIAVWDVRQDLQSKPSTQVKYCVAKVLVNRLLAEWVVRDVSIRRLAVKLPPIIIPQLTKQHKPYIPERMPFAELPGIVATGPLANVLDHGATARFANLFSKVVH